MSKSGQQYVDDVVGTCRYYADEFPPQESYTMVKVKSVTEMGAYVTLLEYDNKEGMVLLSELSKKRIKSLNNVARVGKIECVVVLRVDADKGYIDLSKTRVNNEDKEKCVQRYQKSKTVHGIMINCAQALGCKLKEVYEKVGWPLYAKFGHALEGLKMAVETPDEVFDGILDPNKPEDAQIRNVVMSVVLSKLKPKPSKVRADFEITNFAGDGIDGIKKALRAGIEAGGPEVTINLVAPPLFVMQTNTSDVNNGIAKLNEALKAIKTAITEIGGNLQVKIEPRSVSAKDDQTLMALMDELKAKNAEVSGDDEDEEDMY